MSYALAEHIRLEHQLTPSVRCNILPSAYPFRKKLGDDVLCYCCGVGVDSVAALIGMRDRGLRPDLITFADTGGEKPETYAYVPVLEQWLADNDFPPLAIVRLTPPKAGHVNLYDNCLNNETLPSIAFGRKSCSLRWKKEPQDYY